MSSSRREGARASTVAVSVDVPATSANLGAGFDALALALDLADIFTVEPAPELAPGQMKVTVSGEGADVLPSDGSDRFTHAFLGAVGDVRHGWRVRMDNRIPLARGLGSSAAATVGGLVAGRMLSDGDMSDGDLLALATVLEGHPENAAAALYGGFVVAVRTDRRPSVVRFDPPEELLAVLFIPDRQLETSRMREVLPESVPRSAAVHNVGRASLTVAAMASGRLDLLAVATDDRLHEPYRAAIFPELPGLIAAARAAGALGACLSGAGSTVLAFADGRDLAARVAAAMEHEAGAAELSGRKMVVRLRSQGVVAVGPPAP
ncbi:MAG: homoserine kinase [Chloroflexi bacterium]|nr:homoserine kinase [Chloroflexota bacterium]